MWSDSSASGLHHSTGSGGCSENEDEQETSRVAPRDGRAVDARQTEIRSRRRRSRRTSLDPQVRSIFLKKHINIKLILEL